MAAPKRPLQCGVFVLCGLVVAAVAPAHAFAPRAVPRPTDTPGFVTGRTWSTALRVDVVPSGPPPSALREIIARSRLTMRAARGKDRDAYWRAVAALEEALFFAGRYSELRQVLALPQGDALAAPSRPAADVPFFNGDFAAAFRVYVPMEFIPGLGEHPNLPAALRAANSGRWADAVRLLERVHDSDKGFGYLDFTGQEQTARLLAGDAYAACGRFRAARRRWLAAALLTDSPVTPDMFFVPPQRTSAFLRLAHYNDTPDRAVARPGCGSLHSDAIVMTPRR
ncbi:MAG TPA: hypothetical protein VGD01_01465 [Candidatus Elarobacter sp.]|jgi:hypothetical protein